MAKPHIRFQVLPNGRVCRLHAPSIQGRGDTGGDEGLLGFIHMRSDLGCSVARAVLKRFTMPCPWPAGAAWGQKWGNAVAEDAFFNRRCAL